MKKKVYLAGAMGCYGNNQDIPKAWRKTAKEWFEKYADDFECIDPSDYFEYGKELHQTEKEPMRFDLYKVSHSDVVLVNLKDLDKSLGTSDEILYAYLKEIPIIGFDDTGKGVGFQPPVYSAIWHPWKVEQINRIEVGDNAMEKAMMYIRNYYA